jgi:hypothetical protein
MPDSIQRQRLPRLTVIHRNLGLDDMVSSIEIGVPSLTVRPRYDWYS